MAEKALTIKNGRICFLFILFVTGIFFYPVFFEGKTYYAFDTLLSYLPWSPFFPDFLANNALITDPVNVFYPIHHTFAESLKDGAIPFWDTSIYGGRIFSPYGYPFFYLLHSFLPISYAHDVFLFLHMMGAGVFMFLFLKQVEMENIPAMIGAVSWMFNGYLLVWFEFENVPMMAMSFSGILYFLEYLIRSHRIRAMFGLTVFMALSATASAAQILIYQSIFIVFYFIFRITKLESGKKRVILHCFIAFLAACIISMNFFTYHLARFGGGQRKEFGWSELYKKTGQLPWKYLTTLVFPDIFGSPTRGVVLTPRPEPSQSYNNYNEMCVYPGIFTLLLALSAIVHFRRTRFIPFFLTGAVLSILMAGGSIVYYPFARFVPALNLSTPLRVLYIFGFCVSVLAAFGAGMLLESRDGKYRTGIVWLALTAISVAIAVLVQYENGIKWLHGMFHVPRQLIAYYNPVSPVIGKPLVLLFASLIILFAILFFRDRDAKKRLLVLGIIIIAYDMIGFGRLYNSAVPRNLEFPDTPAIRFLKMDPSKFRIMTMGPFMHNALMPFGLETLGGYASFYPKRYGEILYISQNGPEKPLPDEFSRWSFFRNPDSPLIDVLNTKYILVPRNAALSEPNFKLVFDGEIKIFENLNAFPRFFFVQNYIEAKNPLAALKLVGSFSRETFRKTAIIESSLPFELKKNTGGTVPKITVQSYESNRIKLEVKTSSDGLLIESDNYHPGWKVYVDGKASVIIRANFVMRGIPLKKGNHRVELVFKPFWILLGLFVTLSAWGIVACILVFFGARLLFRNALRKKAQGLS